MRYTRSLAVWILAVLTAVPAMAQSPTAQEAVAPEPAEPQNLEDEKDAAPADKWTLIHAGSLIAEPGKPVLQKQTIVIKNGKIERLVAGFAAGEDYASDAKIVDLSNSYVLPGLIDAHVHLMSGDDVDGSGHEEDVYAVAAIVRNAKKTVDAGVTTVRDMGSSGLALQAYREGWGEDVFVGPRVVLSGEPVTAGADEGDCYDAGSCKKAVRARIEREADWIKLYATCSGFQPCGNGQAPGLFTPDELDAVSAAAATRSLPIAAHAHSVRGINDALRAGARSIEHGSALDTESIRLFIKQKAYLVPTLSVLNSLEGELEEASPGTRLVIEAALDRHPKGVALALQQGVSIGAGSDAPLTAFGEFSDELGWLVKIGMTPTQALRAATVTNAELLMKQTEIGTLASGKSADIIAVDSDPTADIAAMRDVRFVMIKGQIVKQETKPVD